MQRWRTGTSMLRIVDDGETACPASAPKRHRDGPNAHRRQTVGASEALAVRMSVQVSSSFAVSFFDCRLPSAVIRRRCASTMCRVYRDGSIGAMSLPGRCVHLRCNVIAACMFHAAADAKRGVARCSRIVIRWPALCVAGATESHRSGTLPSHRLALHPHHAGGAEERCLRVVRSRWGDPRCRAPSSGLHAAVEPFASAGRQANATPTRRWACAEDRRSAATLRLVRAFRCDGMPGVGLHRWSA